jgi:hypothetical protein
VSFCPRDPLCCFSASVCCCLFRYRLSPETFGYTLVYYTVIHYAEARVYPYLWSHGYALLSDHRCACLPCAPGADVLRPHLLLGVPIALMPKELQQLKQQREGGRLFSVVPLPDGYRRPQLQGLGHTWIFGRVWTHAF